VRVHLAVEHALQLEAAYTPLEPDGIAFDVRRGGFVLFAFGELEELCRIRDGLGGAIELAKLSSQLGAFPAQLLGLLGVLPDGGIFQLAIDLFEALFLRVVLKETPGGRQCDRRGL
jgi:hypothetical protein